jgi:ERCC4-type nuclease
LAVQLNYSGNPINVREIQAYGGSREISVRARSLFVRGYRTPVDIRRASAHELEKVPAIGRSVAEDIKKQTEAAQAAA